MEVLKSIGKFLVKEIQIKKLSYNLYKEVLEPWLTKKVNAPESVSKWDNIMLAGVTQLVEVFLKPKDVVVKVTPNA